MPTQYRCDKETRRQAVSAHPTLNGIDYLEVIDNDAPDERLRQRALLVRCLKAVPPLDRENVRISGGVRLTAIRVERAFPATSLSEDLRILVPDPEYVLVVLTDSYGDFSPYRLALVKSPSDPSPPDGFDSQLSEVEFSFKVDCPSDFDCKIDTTCPPERLPQPQIDYLARDYASFRRLMLDRLAVTTPDWKERNPADLGIALVETLAYAADHLSYRLDAVGTEAYLGTARRRPSIRRIARLLDYPMHDGCNARAWVCFEVSQDLIGRPDRDNPGERLPVLPKSTPLLTRLRGKPAVLRPDGPRDWLAASPAVFETLHDVPRLKLKRNEISFYTWGETRCCLPKGATEATLDGNRLELDLKQGDVLVFEEVLGPETGLPADADPAHRHVVRLDRDPLEVTDQLNSKKVLEISWHGEDALPFPLCLWQLPDGNGNTNHVSVARGNVVLADHGLTLPPKELIPPVPSEEDPYRPRLPDLGLTHAIPWDDQEARSQPAARAIESEPRKALPALSLHRDGEIWTPKRDLLSSDRFSREFVVEMEDDGRAFLRFNSRRPGSGLKAAYRLGSGLAGNVGADAIRHVLTTETAIDAVRNPLPAGGGADPEPIEDVRLYAPQAFRWQQRAVTGDDYAHVTERHPDVQKAVATLRWTGSWHTMFVIVDRKGGRSVDARFEGDLRRWLERFRLAGHDVEIEGPLFIPLDIVFTVCVKSGYFRSDVEAALLGIFSNRDLPDGRRGFFHPDNFTFGQSVFLSPMVAIAMQVPGVDWLDVDDSGDKPNRFGRAGQESQVSSGRIDFARLEIARLDNDPNFPENGKIRFIMRGGL